MGAISSFSISLTLGLAGTGTSGTAEASGTREEAAARETGGAWMVLYSITNCVYRLVEVGERTLRISNEIVFS